MPPVWPPPTIVTFLRAIFSFRSLFGDPFSRLHGIGALPCVDGYVVARRVAYPRLTPIAFAPLGIDSGELTAAARPLEAGIEVIHHDREQYAVTRRRRLRAF